jgi:hypothetical protein
VSLVSRSLTPVPDNRLSPGNPPTDPVYLTPGELVSRFRNGVTLTTFANWRANPESDGPPYTKIGRAILYRIDLLQEWERTRTKPSRDTRGSLAMSTTRGAKPVPNLWSKASKKP